MPRIVPRQRAGCQSGKRGADRAAWRTSAVHLPLPACYAKRSNPAFPVKLKSQAPKSPTPRFGRSGIKPSHTKNPCILGDQHRIFNNVAETSLEDYLATFLERDIPQFGIQVPLAALRRFWIMLSHYHGNLINYSELGRSLQVADTTIRHYLDILESTLMVRVLRPWFSNTSKRLVKRPKIYLKDSGLFHRLQSLERSADLESHPKLGASWEGFALHQLVQISGMSPERFFFWATQAGAEVDLFWQRNGKNYAAEFKYSDAPRRTKSMIAALHDLDLDHLWVVYPGDASYPLDERITVLPVTEIESIFATS